MVLSLFLANDNLSLIHLTTLSDRHRYGNYADNNYGYDNYFNYGVVEDPETTAEEASFDDDEEDVSTASRVWSFGSSRRRN